METLLDTAANNLAARATLDPDLTGAIGAEKTILQFRSKDRFAHSLNIVLAPVIPKKAKSSVVKTCVAILTWGTGGSNTRAEIDFGRGTQIQIAAAFVAIAGRNDGGLAVTSESTLDEAPGPQDVVAMISGVGGRVAFGRATRTAYFVEINAGQKRFVTVPPFAKSFLVTRFPAATAIDVTVLDGLDSSGAPLDSRDEYLFASGVPASRIELFDRAGAVQIANTGLTDINALQVAFELCL